MKLFGQLTVFTLFALGACQDQACPPGYEEYMDEKCFILVKSFQTKSDAEISCQSDINNPGGTLASIKSKREQDFLTNYVFNISGAESSVWLGAERDMADGTFYWNDRSRVTFTNWGEDSPSNDSQRSCIEMESHLSKQDGMSLVLEDGQWRDVSCQRGNWFVCELLQKWTTEKLQREIMDFRLNTVPIGFIYVQLPSQPAPQTLWPFVQWESVTEAYAGQFFRAEGGGSAPFGEMQGENSPRITRVSTEHSAPGDEGEHAWSQPIVPGLGPRLFTAYTPPDTYWRAFLRFEATGGEIRPGNSAVRIWRRVN